ncbi:MAG: DUF5361 domain-containing protein [Coriobacteriia bacterium]|nr:DUF5361 domain-containing protein [Coriobacteriia bacterium]
MCEQLPRKSRVAVKINPDNDWDEETSILSRIEFWCHALTWQKTEDGQKNRKKPEPILPPVSRKKIKEKQNDDAIGMAVDIDEINKRFHYKK